MSFAELQSIFFWYFNCTATGIYELLPGFIAGLLAAVIVAKITKEPSKAVTDIFDEATRADND